jgi:hypothetical protein
MSLFWFLKKILFSLGNSFLIFPIYALVNVGHMFSLVFKIICEVRRFIVFCLNFLFVP